MALPTILFTTGPSSLADPGRLFYNNCSFSPLFETSISGVAVKDNAHRTVKFMEYTLKVDGYATLPDNDRTIDLVMSDLRFLLTKQAGELVYIGRGMDLFINPAQGGGLRDVAWGPVPELTEFQPLGDGRSAKVQWQVKFRITEAKAVASGPSLLVRIGGVAVQLLQFNYETSVFYDEAGFSGLSIKGTMEIPMTRNPNQATRTLTNTVDDFRSVIESRLTAGIDLNRFRVSKREFNVSRDKRTLEWNIVLEEKPYMDLPPDCTVARGVYSVRPARAGMGLCRWLCTLRATYIVRHDRPRRTAWFAFLSLLRLRMRESRHGLVPKLDGNQNPPKGNIQKELINFFIIGAPFGLTLFESILKGQGKVEDNRKAWLMDLSFEEGVYLDSKTVSFSATWTMMSIFSHVLLGSGIWTKLPEKDAAGKSLWAATVRDISIAKSWLPNTVDPKLDVIVDFGGG